MINPVKAARTQSSQSLHEFAQACSVSRVAVQRTESGCYIEVPPAIVNYLLTVLYITDDGVPLTTEGEIHEAYKAFQLFTRRETYKFGVLSPAVHFPVGVSPVVYWRLTSGVSSQLEFCKLLCLHPYVMNKVESGKQSKLPKQLLAALRDAGYDDTLIHDLSEAQREYAKG